MCGIAGFVDHGDFSVEERTATLTRMCQVIFHRGPDDQGIQIDGPVGLGMRRLSIIDLSGGHQPMSGEDGSVTVVFNGEIYNFHELQEQLKARGHLFKTNSDTESIVHAYEEFSDSCVTYLRGMFVFAIWDDKSKTLLLARDRAGKKPLYYTRTARGSFIFGSELKSILQHPDVEREIDLEALDAYITLGYVPDPLSIFRGIHKLPPGHTLTYSQDKITLKQYWDFTYESTPARSEKSYVEELRVLLEDAVRARLISDVPLGAFLSGGIDSSTVVALMAKLMGQPVKTFSIGFREDSYNELKYARITAEKYGTDHHEFFVTPEICEVADELAWHFDEPFADPSAIPTYMVSKLARQYVTVALSGDGGDELFGGYERYLVERNRRMFAQLPKAFRENVMYPLSVRLPHGARGRNLLHNLALDPVHRYLDSVSVFTSMNRSLLYSADFKRELENRHSVTDTFLDHASKVKTGADLDLLLYIDSKTYLPGDILTKVDRMSMAASLETRAPLLDQKLIDFVTRIPAALKIVGNETKYILKRAVKGLVPDEIMTRPKQGFGLPLAKWINQELRGRIRETLTETITRQRGYFEPSYIKVILDEHERGRRDHSYSLWALLMLELWHRQFLDSKPSLAPVVTRDTAVCSS
ncbi:MAG TPA: asparagine synthase (glutamine-hydrolyzing) [Pyrinomonadaceae bacterium]|nr:asparagine synthase (glutamine-hydrolyzing) [Pyrinomonadaceae bacterium]